MTKILLLFMMIPAMALSQYTSKTTGGWATGTNWIGDVSPPLTGGTKLGDDVNIASSTVITLSNSLEVQSGATLTIDGELIITGNITFKNGSTILVNPGGLLHIQSSGINANNSTDVTVNGQLIVDDDFEAGAGSTIEGSGEVTISGTSSGDGTIFGDATGCSGCSFSGGGSLPITLIHFGAEEDNLIVCLNWVVASQINNNYFTIYKSKDGYEWEDIVDIEGHGTTNTTMSYKWVDNYVEYGVVYYKLRQTDYDGEYEEFSPIAVTIQDPNNRKEIISTINITGQEINPQTKGLIINIYSDGSAEKKYNDE